MAANIPANDGSQGVYDASRDGEILYNYHQLHMSLDKDVDAVFCLGSLDPRVAVRAAQLFLDGYGRYLIFAGGVGRLTKGRYDKPEAEVFADIALEMGVSKDKLLIEPHSTNTGENIQFTYALLEEKGLQLNSFLLVQKPYMERRTYATFKKQWPDPDAKIAVTSPQLQWSEYPNESNPEDLVINIAVGDLIRIQEYPAKGFQIPQVVPIHVWEATQRLISAGYNTHLP
ncbi:DUF218 domain-containing protein [Annulohypoxylon moriforme]|nr:DUF218 domain-containing protein [Annulohypoxylon moriforme]